jgi:flavin-dependent dehydrogenase
MAKRHDLVIIGAGPAGLMAAKTAAERGLDVVLVESRRQIGRVRRACCAQLVMDEGYENETIELRDGELVFRQSGFTVAYDGPAVDVVNKYYWSPRGHRIHFAHEDGQPLAIKFDKGRLLEGLWREVQAAGVDARTGTMAVDASDSPGGVQVTVVSDGARSELAADRAIVAEGVNARLAGVLGLNDQRRLFATALVLKYTVEGVEGFEPRSWNLHYGRAYRSNGAVIVGPSLEDGVVEITLMGNQKLRPEKIYHDLCTESPLARRLAGARVLDRQGCAVKAFAALRTPYRGNVLAIGDTAAYVEVEVQGALMCGFQAGRAVADEARGESGLAHYASWWRESFEFNGDDHLKVAQGYALVPAFADDELDYLFALLEDQVLEGSYSQYKTPELIWRAILEHDARIARERPGLHEKIERKNELTLSGTF